MWFEGIEKKLEIVLSKPCPALRTTFQPRWQEVVNACGAEIISQVSNAHMDAYLLSESSLFVWEDRILMITCGRTRLVNAALEIFTFLPPDEVAQLFYERKNLMFPTEQCSDFEQDIAKLTPFFPGKSFRFGAANAEHMHVFVWGAPLSNPFSDSTLQILMNHMRPPAMEAFSQKTKDLACSVQLRNRLFERMQSMQLDEFYFSPQGYSCNAILANQYMTLHVSPQAESSYTSFEMNFVHETKGDILSEVLSLFSPNHFLLALTTAMDDISQKAFSALCVPAGYRSVGKGTYEFEAGYLLTYINFEKTTS